MRKLYRVCCSGMQMFLIDDEQLWRRRSCLQFATFEHHSACEQVFTLSLPHFFCLATVVSFSPVFCSFFSLPQSQEAQYLFNGDYSTAQRSFCCKSLCHLSLNSSFRSTACLQIISRCEQTAFFCSPSQMCANIFKALDQRKKRGMVFSSQSQSNHIKIAALRR